MKKLSHPPVSPSRLVMALTIAQMSSLYSPLQAADAIARPTEDVHHDKMLKIAMGRNSYCPEHFFLPEGKTVPIFDIRDAARFRAADIHREQKARHQAAISLAASPAASPSGSPTSSPEKSPSSSVLANIAAVPGHILWSPVYAAQGLYSIMPSWRSPIKSSLAAVPGTAGSAPLKSDDPGKGFIKIGGQAEAKSTPLPAAALNSLTASPTSPPAVGILSDPSAEEVRQGSSDKTAVSILPSPIIYPGEGGSTPSLSRAVKPTYAEDGSRDLSIKGSAASRRPTLIYSGDGGGGRGLIPAIQMAYFEKQTNTHMSNVFDYVIGTSISGIEVLGWTINNQDGKPCMTGTDSVDLFDLHFDSIFPQASRWNIPARIWSSIKSLQYTQYDPKPLETLLQHYLSQASMAAARTKVFVTSIDANTNTPFIMSNLTHPDGLAWQAGRGGSAAPTYLPAFQADSFAGNPLALDGGIALNNPADYILDFARAYEKTHGNHHFEPVVLSFGTGVSPFTPVPSDGGTLPTVAPLIEASIMAQVSGTHLTLKTVLKENVNYFRTNPTLPYSIPLDSLSALDMTTLRTAAESQFDIVDKFIETDAVRLRLEAK